MINNPVGAEVHRVSVALGVLITFAVVLRFLARWKSKAEFAADDVLIVASLLPQYATIVLGYVCTYIVLYDHVGACRGLNVRKLLTTRSN